MPRYTFLPSRLPRKQAVGFVLVVIGVAGLGMGVWSWRHPQAGAPASPDSRQSQSDPSSLKPTQKSVDEYSVDPDLPRYVAIPAIKLGKTKVVQLGLSKNNQIVSPGNIFEAGWYSQSSKPGQDGAMFIFGHASSWEAEGAFYSLDKLEQGDTIIVTRGDNEQFTYKVVSSKVYPADKVDMDAVLSPVQPGKQGLNLMTCAGQIIKGTSDFSQRLVVFTVRAAS